VADVEFAGWTADHVLRHPSFQGLREEFALTNPDRVLYPDVKITKRELAEYYVSIADRILPHIARRPLSVVRCPSGYDKQCFYQKHGSAGTPKAIRTADEYVYIEDVDGLVALVQMGVLEIHPWGSRIDRLEQADRITL